jgi:hypothetical protein
MEKQNTLLYKNKRQRASAYNLDLSPLVYVLIMTTIYLIAI